MKCTYRKRNLFNQVYWETLQALINYSKNDKSNSHVCHLKLLIWSCKFSWLVNMLGCWKCPHLPSQPCCLPLYMMFAKQTHKLCANWLLPTQRSSMPLEILAKKLCKNTMYTQPAYIQISRHSANQKLPWHSLPSEVEAACISRHIY